MTECFARGECQVADSAQMAEELEKMREVIERFDFETLFSVEY